MAHGRSLKLRGINSNRVRWIAVTGVDKKPYRRPPRAQRVRGPARPHIGHKKFATLVRFLKAMGRAA